MGDALPVAVEVARPAIQKDEAGEVDRPGRVGEQRRIQRIAERVRREDVEAVVPQERRDPGHRVEDSLHARPHALLRGTAASRSRGVGGAEQVEEVRPLDVVELESTGQAVQHVLRYAARTLPRSMRVRYSIEIPASRATSSRRRPGTRRCPPKSGRPACSGVILARRDVRNSRISLRMACRSLTAASLETRLAAREALPVPPPTVTPSRLPGLLG